VPSQASTPASGRADPLEPTSRHLLAGARRGDPGAVAQLVSRYLPQLHRWAHGRLARWARTLVDTADVIQDTLLRTLGRLDAFEPRGRDALAAYLRTAVRNRISDEHRRVVRRGMPLPLSETLADPAASPLERAMTSEMQARYQAALARLSRPDQELIVAHVELDYTHEQLGCMMGRSRNAARMALRRAIDRLAEQMRDR